MQNPEPGWEQIGQNPEQHWWESKVTHNHLWVQHTHILWSCACAPLWSKSFVWQRRMSILSLNKKVSQTGALGSNRMEDSLGLSTLQTHRTVPHRLLLRCWRWVLKRWRPYSQSTVQFPSQACSGSHLTPQAKEMKDSGKEWDETGAIAEAKQ